VPDNEPVTPGAGPAGEDAGPAPSQDPGTGAPLPDDDTDDPVARLSSLAAGAFNAPSMRLVLVAASVVVIIVGMKMMASIIAPVILSLVITIAISPLMSWQIRKGVPNAVAFITTLIVTGIIGIAITLLLITSLARFIADLPSYADELQPYWDALMKALESVGVDTSDLFDLQNIDPKTVVSTGANVASGLIDTMSALFLMALTILFMLMEASTISGKLRTGMAGGVLKRMDELSADMREFVKVTAAMGAIVAILETILLYILGVPNALLWGLLSFFLSFIPFIGFVVALVPPTIMGLITGGWVTALLVLAAYLIINTLSDNLFKPRIMGTRTNLSPLTVFLSVMLWGWVLGPLGGLLAVPMTLLAKRLILEAYDEWQWLSIVIGDVPHESRPRERKGLRARLRPHHRSNSDDA
jgi:predicted PurR-regulated permease PerM